MIQAGFDIQRRAAKSALRTMFRARDDGTSRSHVEVRSTASQGPRGVGKVFAYGANMRFSHLSPLLLPVAFLACDAGPSNDAPPSENLGQTEEAVTNVCPGATTVSGIDIASFQHPNGAGIHWGQVATAEKFVIIKASEGTGYTNTYYAGDASGARAAGLHVGAYHFLAPSSQTGESGAAQADHYASAANVQAGDMAPMLDVETSPSYNNVLPSVADITGWLQEARR